MGFFIEEEGISFKETDGPHEAPYVVETADGKTYPFFDKDKAEAFFQKKLTERKEELLHRYQELQEQYEDDDKEEETQSSVPGMSPFG